MDSTKKCSFLLYASFTHWRRYLQFLNQAVLWVGWWWVLLWSTHLKISVHQHHSPALLTCPARSIIPQGNQHVIDDLTALRDYYWDCLCIILLHSENHCVMQRLLYRRIISSQALYIHVHHKITKHVKQCAWNVLDNTKLYLNITKMFFFNVKETNTDFLFSLRNFSGFHLCLETTDKCTWVPNIIITNIL